MTSARPLRARLGAVIQRRRAALGLSQEAFADRVGVHRTFMSTVERGRTNLSLDNLERIAQALGVPPGILLLDADTVEEERRAPADPSRGSDATRDPDA